MKSPFEVKWDASELGLLSKKMRDVNEDLKFKSEMAKWDKAESVVRKVLMCFVALFLCIASFGVGAAFLRVQAIDAGVGKWTVDKYGSTSFEWVTNSPAISVENWPSGVLVPESNWTPMVHLTIE